MLLRLRRPVAQSQPPLLLQPVRRPGGAERIPPPPLGRRRECPPSYGCSRALSAYTRGSAATSGGKQHELTQASRRRRGGRVLRRGNRRAGGRRRVQSRLGRGGRSLLPAGRERRLRRLELLAAALLRAGVQPAVRNGGHQRQSDAGPLSLRP